MACAQKDAKRRQVYPAKALVFLAPMRRKMICMDGCGLTAQLPHLDDVLVRHKHERRHQHGQHNLGLQALKPRGKAALPQQLSQTLQRARVRRPGDDDE